MIRGARGASPSRPRKNGFADRVPERSSGALSRLGAARRTTGPRSSRLTSGMLNRFGLGVASPSEALFVRSVGRALAALGDEGRAGRSEEARNGRSADERAGRAAEGRADEARAGRAAEGRADDERVGLGDELRAGDFDPVVRVLGLRGPLRGAIGMRVSLMYACYQLLLSAGGCSGVRRSISARSRPIPISSSMASIFSSTSG